MQKILLIALAITLATCYNLQIAHDLAHLSQVAYESLANINAWTCTQCSKYSVKNQKGFYSSVANIQGYAGYQAKTNAVIVAFRGSVDVKNWIFNLETASVAYPSCSGCMVHSGFYVAYKGVSSLVRTEVDRLLGLYKTAKLVITGHSLGGAMAVLCALEMKEVHGKVDYVYTYGQPRVGNSNFASFYQVRIPQAYHVINYADLVPHVPPSSFSFVHGGHQIWYNPRGMKTYKQCVSEDKTCSDSVAATALNTDDHQLTNYMQLALNSTISQNLKKQSSYQYSSEELAQFQQRRIQQIKQLYANYV